MHCRRKIAIIQGSINKCQMYFLIGQQGEILHFPKIILLWGFYSLCSMKKCRYHSKKTKSLGKLLSVIVSIYFSASYNYLSFSILGNKIKSELKAPIKFCLPISLYGVVLIVTQHLSSLYMTET